MDDMSMSCSYFIVPFTGDGKTIRHRVMESMQTTDRSIE